MPENLNTSRGDSCIDAVESSPPRRSYLRLASLQIEKDKSLCLPPLLGKPLKDSPERDGKKLQSNLIEYYAPSSKAKMRKKFIPQHRSPQVNESVSSILKMPKYSRRLSLDLDPEMGSEKVQRRRRSTYTRSASMPPIGPLPESFSNSTKYLNASDSNTSNESNYSSDEWAPKSVEFKPTDELYLI